MKSLEKILSIVGLVGALAACSDSGKDSCTKDTDCREPRICDSDLGYCVDSNGGSSGSSSGSSSNPCGNSPLFGKYLQQIGNCTMGADKPFDEHCKGYLVFKGYHHIVDYYGLTISSETGSTTYTRDDIPCSMLAKPEICEVLKCWLIKNPFLYWTDADPNPNDDFHKISEDFFSEITDIPYVDETTCAEYVAVADWHTSCQDK